MSILISDALPIQFWRPDCDTWNQSSPEGMHHYKFCQPFNCDDTIRIEFFEEDTNTYDLHIINEDEETIQIIPISRQAQSNTNVIPSLSDFINTDSGTSWTLGANPSVSINLGGSQRLDHAVSLQAGTYELTTNAIVPAGNLGLALRFHFQGSEVTATSVLNGTNTQTIVIPGEFDEMFFSVVDLEAGVDVVQVLSASMVQLSGVYSLSFTPTSLGICNEQIYFKIVKSNGTPDVDAAVSDPIDVKTSHTETVLINYSNHRNFAGLYYSSVSPDQEFNIRIPAIFFKQRLPQTKETHQLSSNRVIALNSQTKIQRLLSTDRMPNYMHVKMSLILQHQTLYINSQYWVAEENYERTEPADTRDTLEKYTIWLTKKEYVVRNIL